MPYFISFWIIEFPSPFFADFIFKSFTFYDSLTINKSQITPHIMSKCIKLLLTWRALQRELQTNFIDFRIVWVCHYTWFSLALSKHVTVWERQKQWRFQTILNRIVHTHKFYLLMWRLQRSNRSMVDYHLIKSCLLTTWIN